MWITQSREDLGFKSRVSDLDNVLVDQKCELSMSDKMISTEFYKRIYRSRGQS